MDVLPAGTLLKNGGYCVEAMLGRGGFGITYQAHDLAHDRRLALKELFPTDCRRGDINSHQTNVARPGGLLTAAAFERSRQQFLTSAQTLQRFRHPGIVTVYDWWEENNTAYLTMELLQGRTLLQLIETEGAVGEARARHYIEPLSEALDSLHRLGLLHLDIKPDNVMVCTAASGGSFSASTLHERVVLFDFDLMQSLGDTQGRDTRPLSAHCGTPGYAPLEQYAQHSAYGTFTDLYALGATTYHLLTATTPPAAPDRAHEETLVFKTPREFHRELSPQLEEAVLWALEMAPRDRPQTLEEWRHALDSGRPVIVTPNIISPDTDTAANAAPTNTAPPLPALPQSDGWFQVAVRDSQVVFPARCACCLKNAETTLPLERSGLFAPAPYCHHCARHVEASRKSVVVTATGMATGLFIALVGFLLTNIVLAPLGLILHFSAMAYGALQVQFAESLRRDECSERKQAVCLLRASAGKWLLGFRNLRYAHEFRNTNGTKIL